MMTKLGYYFPWYFLGGAFELIAGVLMCKMDWKLYLIFENKANISIDTVTAETSTAAIYGYTALMAIGVGAFNQAGYSVVQAKVKPEEIPYALGYMMFCK